MRRGDGIDDGMDPAVDLVLLLGRRPHALTPFEWLVLVVTGVSGMTAVRNAGWFAMAAIMLLPPAFALAPRFGIGIVRRAPATDWGDRL